MTPRKKKPDDAALKAAIVDAALPHVPFDGFTDKVLETAAKEAGADKDTLKRLFPEGALSLVEACSDFADGEMEKRLAALDLKAMKIRERIATAVLTRIDVLRPQKEASRRAMAFLSLPPHIPLATKLLYRTVDAMWRAAGDTSTDFNFYTKRGILAGVYSATLVRWFNDTTEDESATREFLAARIDNVMTFEKFKAEVTQGLARLPSLSDVLANFARRT
ncbi:MAG TPA: COQ9 family protein [Rhizomicrobium sp.]|jgi:ubiquinone biosynthesis protein COQ9|nr:COQ9 family protein [Rhizomicrobium sp.]